MRTYCVDNLPREIELGRQTEKGIETLRFDCSPWLDKWPGMTCYVWVTAPGTETAYPADASMEGTLLTWTVGESDTAIAGSGMIEIAGMADGKKKLSQTVNTRVLRSTTAAPGDPPEYAQGWVDTVLDAAERAELAADRAEASAGGGSGSGGVTYFIPGDTLTLDPKTRVLSVNTADTVEQDNTLPVTSAAVYNEVGNINALLATI